MVPSLMAECPRGHKDADLKSAVLALNQPGGSNPSSVAKYKIKKKEEYEWH